MTTFFLRLMRAWGGRKRRLFPTSSTMANFGCGDTFHSAWDNFDFRSHHPGVSDVNLLKPLPFRAASFAMVYVSHVLEHLPREKVVDVLGEFQRILKPAGILRVVVPDLENLAREYLRQLDSVDRGEDGAKERHAWMILELVDQFVRRQSGGFMARWWKCRPLPARDYVLARTGQESRGWVENADRPGATVLSTREIFQTPGLIPRRERRFLRSGERHQWAYDRISLQALLTTAGFHEIRVCRAHESALPEFASFALDTTPEGQIRKPDSLFMEARKRKA